MTEYTGNDFYCDMVLNGRIKVVVEHATPNIIAFRHTKPLYPTHIVVVPKTHISSLIDLNDNTLLIELMDVIKKIADKVVSQKREARIVTNLGNYQDSKHLHFHITSGKVIS